MFHFINIKLHKQIRVQISSLLTNLRLHVSFCLKPHNWVQWHKLQLFVSKCIVDEICLKVSLYSIFTNITKSNGKTYSTFEILDAFKAHIHTILFYVPCINAHLWNAFAKFILTCKQNRSSQLLENNENPLTKFKHRVVILRHFL